MHEIQTRLELPMERILLWNDTYKAEFRFWCLENFDEKSIRRLNYYRYGDTVHVVVEGEFDDHMKTLIAMMKLAWA